MATDSSILAWRIPWTEEPGGSRSIGLQSLAWLSDQATRTPPKFQIIKQLQEQNCAWAHLTGGLKLAKVNRKIFLTMTFCSESKSFLDSSLQLETKKEGLSSCSVVTKGRGKLAEDEASAETRTCRHVGLGMKPCETENPRRGGAWWDLRF